MAEDEFDIAGAATGAVDQKNLLGAEKIKEGDVIIAMPASGLHANGYSLVRHIIKNAKLDLATHSDEFGKTIGEQLLTPTEIYSLDCLALINGMKDRVHAFAHITGGGLASNTARVIPDHLQATFDRSTWSLPLEMSFLAEVGSVGRVDMEKTWNVGIGMVGIVESQSADLALTSLAARGMKGWVCGVIERRRGELGSELRGEYRRA